MVDALNLDDRFVGWCCKHAVIAASPWMVGIYLATQRIRPELCGLINIRYATINQKSAKTRMMHSGLFGYVGDDDSKLCGSARSDGWAACRSSLRTGTVISFHFH